MKFLRRTNVTANNTDSTQIPNTLHDELLRSTVADHARIQAPHVSSRCTSVRSYTLRECEPSCVSLCSGRLTPRSRLELSPPAAPTQITTDKQLGAQMHIYTLSPELHPLWGGRGPGHVGLFYITLRVLSV